MFIRSAIVVTLCVTFLGSAIGEDIKDVRQVEYGGIRLSVPKVWQEQPPSNRMRLAQFVIPGASEKDAAELAVFSFPGGGSVKQNVVRWIGQFEESGRKVAVVSGKAATGEYVFVDLSGTYKKSVGPPILRKTTPVPNSRMLGVMFVKNGKGTVFLKLVGPAETVTENVAALKHSFGANEASEKELRL